MVDWATVVTSVLLSVVGSVIVTEYKFYRESSLEESEELEGWYDDSLEYASEVRRTWNRLFTNAENPGLNLSEIQAELSQYESQISRHASSGEQLGAEVEVIEALDEFADQCRRPTELPLHTNSTDEFIEYRDDIIEAADAVTESVQERNESNGFLKQLF